MNSGSQRDDSVPENSQDSSSPSVLFLRYGLTLKSKMLTSMFQIAKWRKDGEGPAVLCLEDSGCYHIVLLASHWPKHKSTA